MKVVINKCYGGFGLSDEAILKCIERGMTLTEVASDGKLIDKKADFVKSNKKMLFGNWYFPNNERSTKFRSSSILVSVVEEMGDEASGSCAELKVIEIPYNTDKGWYIEEYDGQEWVAQSHETWG